MPNNQNDLARTVLAVLSMGVLIGLSLWILRPFLGALIWAGMIAVATWPILLAVQKHLWGKRYLAVLAMTVALFLVLVVPLSLAIGTIVSNADDIADWAKAASEFKLPAAPSWLAGLPLVGESFARLWADLAAKGIQELAAKAVPYAGGLTKWFVSEVGSFGIMFVQFLLTVVIAAILYAYGESTAKLTLRFGTRLAGARGEATVRLAAKAIRGVALGVVVTALVQSLIGGIGLALAGVPFAAVLTAVMFMLALAQIGAVPVMIPALIWLYWSGDIGWGSFLLVVTVFVGALDNVLRPILIKKGADLPLLLVFAGVIGGLISFGLIGIFVGPVVLAVAYTLLEAWMSDGYLPTRAPKHRKTHAK
jgi:predicted PurR-regulated permease PerM